MVGVVQSGIMVLPMLNWHVQSLTAFIPTLQIIFKYYVARVT